MEKKNEKLMLYEIYEKLNDFLNDFSDKDNDEINNLYVLRNYIFKIIHRKSKNGLYPYEVMKLMEYIQRNNSWANLLECHEKGRKTYKYYTMKVDTRTGTVWAITFHGGNNEDITFRTENDYILIDKIYDFLDKKIDSIIDKKDNNKQNVDMDDNNKQIIDMICEKTEIGEI